MRRGRSAAHVLAVAGSELECDVPRRVLVRLRAVLTSRESLHGREFESVHVPVREAKLAVSAPSGKPLSYATVLQSGKAALFTAKGCRLRVSRRTASPFGYPQLQAMGPTTQTVLAIGTLKGTPISYASIAGTKQARLFIATDCQED